MNGDRVLSPDEFAAQLTGTSTKDLSAELSPDDFAAALQDVTPGKPGPLRSAASGFLGGVAGIVDAAEAIGSALAPGGGILAGRRAPKDNPLASLSADIRGAQDLVQPPETRGRGNFLTEDVPEILGGMAPGVIGGAINPALGAAAFGAQAGGPAYFEVIQEGGTPEEGMVALVGNAALAQLERVGAGGSFIKAVRKLSGSQVGLKAINSLAAHFAIGGTKEVGTEVVEQIGHDLILAGLTPAEVNVLDNALAIGKDPAVWTVGLLGAGAELATRRGAQTAPAAPGAGQATPMTAQRPTEPIAPQRAPIAPGAVQQPQAPAGPALPPAEVQMLGEGGERGLVPAPRQIGPGAQTQVQQQQALTAEPEPAKPKSRRDELAGRKPHELTYDEAEEALQLEREYVKNADVLALGEEGAREWNKLQRQANSSDDRVSTPALRKIQEMEAGFTPEQNRLLYGIGETGMNEDTLRALSRALGDVRSATDEADLGRIVGMSLGKIGDADPNSVDPSSDEALAFARLAEAQRVMAERGMDTAKVSKAALERAQQLYGEDAEDMLRRWKQPQPSGIPGELPAPDPVGSEPVRAEEPVVTPAEQPAPSAEVPTPPVQEPAKFTPPETAPEVKPEPAKGAGKSPKAAAAAYMKASNEHAKYVEKSVETAKDRLRRLEKEQGIFEANAKDTDRRRFFDVYGFKSEADAEARRAQLEAEVKAAKFDLGEANTRASELLAKKEKADADWKAVEPPKAAKAPVSDDPEAKTPTRAWDDDYADAKEIANGDTPEWASPRAKAWGEKLSEFYDQGKSEGAWKRTLPKRPKAGEGGTPPPKKPSGGATEMFAGGPNPFGKFSNVSTSKFKKWAKKWLTSAGDKPRDVRRELELAEGATDAEMIEGGRYAKQLDAALRKVDPNWRATETAEQVDDAFEGDEAALRALPEEARAAIADMRAHLDRLIRSQVKKGGVIDPDKMPEFAKKILESQGSYARRQYKAYLDPEWADKVPADVRDSLFRLWQSWAQDMDPADMIDLRRSARQRTSEGEAAFKRRRQLSNEIAKLKRGDPRRAELVKERASLRLTAKKYTAEAQAARTELAGRKAFKGKSDEDIQAEMDATLQAAKEKTQNPFKDIASGKLGRKDLSVYKRRKAIPAELRAFLGEVKDPIANYATSVFKIAQNVARHEASVNIRKMGLGKFLFEKPTGDAVAKLSSDGNKALAPLDGLYVTPELKAALVQLDSSALPVWLKLVARANSAIKWGKVIGQPWAFMRNLWGNVPMSIANGHLPAYFNSKEWDAAFGKGDLETLKRLKRLGIVGDNISTVEWDDAKRAAKATPEEIAKGALEPGVLGKVKQLAETAFSAADNAPKIRFFFAEEAALREAGYSAKEAERIAADRTRDLMPTPERMAEALKQFRKQPLLGTFFSFRAEVIRTTANRIKLISEELKSENPKVRAMGQRRAVGQIVAATMTPAAAYAINMLNGVDSDEDEDKRNFLAPWDKNSRIVWFGEETKGEYFDLSDLDPFTMGSDPAMRVLAGADPEEAIKGLVREELEAFVGPSMVTQLALDIINGHDRDGKPIDNMGAHIFKQVQPGFVAAARRAPETGVLVEAGSIVSGVRRYQFDVEKSLSFDSARYKRIQSQAKEKEGRQSRKDPEGIKGYTEELEMTREEAFDEMARKAQAALRLGVPPREVRKILSESLSTAEASAIISGKYRPHKESRKVLAP